MNGIQQYSRRNLFFLIVYYNNFVIRLFSVFIYDWKLSEFSSSNQLISMEQKVILLNFILQFEVEMQ